MTIKYKGEYVRIIGVIHYGVKAVIDGKVKLIPSQYKIEDSKRTWTEYVDPSDLEY